MFGNDPVLSTGTDIKPVENSVGEVQLVTGTLPAEYGHTSGGVLTVAKKSGTNQYHGTASDLGRTRSMTHRQFFNLYRTSDPQPGAPDGVPAWFMQMDASLSGPISIPKVYNGKNKTFFFFGYQKLIEKKSHLLHQPDTDAGRTEWRLHVRRCRPAALRSVDHSLYALRGLELHELDAGPDCRQRIPVSQMDPSYRKLLSFNPWAAAEYARVR